MTNNQPRTQPTLFPLSIFLLPLILLLFMVTRLGANTYKVAVFDLIILWPQVLLALSPTGSIHS